MPDEPDNVTGAGTWADAFARLPMEAPPDDAWQRVAASLDARRAAVPRVGRQPRRPRVAGWLALAAVLALAVVLPWRQQGTTVDTARADLQPASTAGTGGTPPASPTLADLQAESALLEALLAHASDGRVASGSAAAMAAELEARLAAIDAALADPALPPDRERALWSERVQALQALASFEGTRRWLAANGEHYDAALVQVN